MSGSTAKDRFVLNIILDTIGKGDKLVVWKLDRLARNMNDLTKIIEALNSKRAALEILDQKIGVRVKLNIRDRGQSKNY